MKIQKTRKILLLAHQPTFLLLIDFSYYFCFQFSNCSSQSFYNEWWSTSSCRLHTGIILDFNSHRTIISNFNKSFMLKTRQSHSKMTLHWKSKQGNKAESIMQTTQFSAKNFYGKRHCIKESRNWWNEKEAKHKENYYFNFNFMNCLRARLVFISFPFFRHGWRSRGVQRISRFRRFYCDNYWRNVHLSAILWSISNVQPNALHRLSQAYSTAQIKRLTITHKRKMLQNPYSECMRCAFLNWMNKTKEKKH